MKAPILVSGVLLLGVLGGVGGYVGGAWLEQPSPVDEVAAAAPLAGFPTQEPLPRKTPEPNTLAGLKADELTFRTQSFTVRADSGASLRLSIRMARGWQLTRDPKAPREVKFLDPLKERGVRVESGLAPKQSTTDSMHELVNNLKSSQAYENDLRILSQTDSQVTGVDGQPRTVSTLTYTYIPIKTRRYVVVRWVATGGDDTATVEMSVTGLPQDAAGLAPVLAEATKSVQLKD
ncbi:hypothetical protein GCM10009744_26680 [Kribbella alba]|uniref:LppX_LprAFG lipoprotein n=1 Tax=Kribbella alba TaxID=190197 RepID=A0ABN2FB17_9ACTN